MGANSRLGAYSNKYGITNKFQRSRKDIVPFWLVKPLVGRSHIIKDVLYWMFRTVVFVDWLIFGQQFS